MFSAVCRGRKAIHLGFWIQKLARLPPLTAVTNVSYSNASGNNLFTDNVKNER